MKTFVINLKDASERKRYMESVLHPYAHFLDIEFIEAVDGRKFTQVSDLDFRQFVHMPVVLPASCCFR